MIPTARDLARELVETLAPEELPTFAVVAEPYFVDPRRAERRLRDHDDPLGFGLGDAVGMVTPVIALISGSVVTALSDTMADQLRSSGGKLLRKLTKKKPDELPAAKYTETQLAEIRALAYKRAIDLGMQADQADTLADAVIGALVRDR